MIKIKMNNNNMNWYNKTIIAQEVKGLQGFLTRLNASTDIIQYILSQDKETAQFLTNIFRKNPSLNLVQLQSTQVPNKTKIDPYFKTEKIRAANLTTINSPFYNWILVNCRKLRRGLPVDKINKDEQIKFWAFIDKLEEIKDWYNSIIPDISSFSIEQAQQSSDEWHQQMASQGEGTSYAQTDLNLIIYGPTWKNKEYNGWTIQKIISENDLTCEGNKMDHCVGSYYDNVENGNSIIYSLRDPQNNPHVTMEINNYNEVEQIRGKSNSEPKNTYKDMIKEWITSPKNPGINNFSGESDPFGEISIKYDNIEKVIEAIEMCKRGEGDYGLASTTSLNATDIIEIAINIEENSRYPEYSGDITSIPERTIEWIFNTYNDNPEIIIQQIKYLEDFAQKQSEEAWDQVVGWDWGFEYPNEEDYETTEDFEEALEEYNENIGEAEDEAIGKTIQGGISRDIFKIINK
jgi:hypothetical protein